MREAFLVTGLRTPIGRYGGVLAPLRADDMVAHVLRALMARMPHIPSSAVDDIILGCANQAGEDNRNVARMAGLLAGFDVSVAGTTVNRLCGSGMEAVGMAARAIKAGEAELIIAGGVESMSRAPFAMPKASDAFSRSAELFDTTIGWRFVNPLMQQRYGIDSMPETAENVAAQCHISRADQDRFALQSQTRTADAQKRGRFNREIIATPVPQRKGAPLLIDTDEHPRLTTLEKLSALPTPFRTGGSVTAGNASGVNDGAAAVLIASANACKTYNLMPLARITGMSVTGVEPRVMGLGPVPATQKLLARHNKHLKDIALIELNEAFAAQALACLRQWGLPDDAPHINPNGGAIALGHPLGMSGTRLALTAALEMNENSVDQALCTMCIGVGQGIALMLEKA